MAPVSSVTILFTDNLFPSVLFGFTEYVLLLAVLHTVYHFTSDVFCVHPSVLHVLFIPHPPTPNHPNPVKSCGMVTHGSVWLCLQSYQFSFLSLDWQTFLVSCGIFYVVLVLRLLNV